MRKGLGNDVRLEGWNERSGDFRAGEHLMKKNANVQWVMGTVIRDWKGKENKKLEVMSENS